MKKIKRYIIRNWFWITVGLILTKFAVEKGCEQRGRFCIGGEWLILPAILMVVHLIPAIIRDLVNAFGEEDEDDTGEITEICQGMENQGDKHIR